jgi:hypothetical protein
VIFFAVRTFQPKEALALQQAERLRNDYPQHPDARDYLE